MRLTSKLLSGCDVCQRIYNANFCAFQWRVATIFWLVLGLMIAPWLNVIPAQAQSVLTYVAGSGSDGNPCTAQSPCLTLQRALTQTLAGGEIYTLSSANYGYVTINQAVSINATQGATGVLASAGVSGI